MTFVIVLVFLVGVVYLIGYLGEVYLGLKLKKAFKNFHETTRQLWAATRGER